MNSLSHARTTTLSGKEKTTALLLSLPRRVHLLLLQSLELLTASAAHSHLLVQSTPNLLKPHFMLWHNADLASAKAFLRAEKRIGPGRQLCFFLLRFVFGFLRELLRSALSDFLSMLTQAATSALFVMSRDRERSLQIRQDSCPPRWYDVLNSTSAWQIVCFLFHLLFGFSLQLSERVY